MNERSYIVGIEAERTAQDGADPAFLNGERLREAVAFFREEKGFGRLMPLMIEKYRSLGRVGGSVKLRDLTPEEREAFSSLLGVNYEGCRTAAISLKQFVRALEKTRFAGIPLEVLLEGLAGEPLISDKKRREREEARKRASIDSLRERFPGNYCRDWLDAVLEKRPGTRGVHRAYDRDPQSFAEMMEHVLAALMELEKRKENRDSDRMERLPLFADRITGDPHGFDPDTERGRILVAALTFLRAKGTGDNEPPVIPGSSSLFSTETLTELYHFFGLLRDDLTNFVTCTGLLAFNRQDELLSVFEAACRSRSVLNVPLREIVRVAWACPVKVFLENDGQIDWSVKVDQSASSSGNHEEIKRDQTDSFPAMSVFVVENSGVFSALLDEWEDPIPPPLICTHGQIKLAALLLLDTLAAAGAVIHYSGDFDPEGILMADRLLRRHPDRVKPWRYDVHDYLCCCVDKKLSPRRLKQLTGVCSPALQPVKEEILQSGRPGYQERMAKRLLSDLRKIREQYNAAAYMDDSNRRNGHPEK